MMHAHRRSQALSLVPSVANASVLQRQCACGQHTGGGKCLACEGNPQSLKDVAQGGLSGSGGALPYLDRIQDSFGRHHDLTRVRAHADGRAAEAAARIGARAYASGERIAFAGTPSLHTAAHEAAHVVQQRAGVRPAGGVGHVGDAYERHADAVANRVVQQQSSEELLAPYAAAHSGSGQENAVQMSAQNTFYGKLTDTKFQRIDGAVGSLRGLHLQISFEPGVAVDATKIAMVQSVRRASEGKATINDPAQQNRIIAQGPAEGYRIDRATATANNPVFGADPLPAGKGLTDTPATNAPAGTDPRETATYQVGFRYFDNKTLKKQDAFLDDMATWNARKSVSMNFETTAVAIEGKQAGTYYGSVKWGWEFDANGELKALDFAKVSDGTPSQNFLAPAAKWNASTARGTLVTRNAPTQVYGHRGDVLFPTFTLAQNTTVTTTLSFISGADTYLWATAADGLLIGKQGYINVADMTDKGDGPPTADLPVPTAPQGKPDASTFVANGITAVTGQDPESLLRLDAVTAVVFGTNDADTMAMLTDLSDLVTDLAAGPQHRAKFRVLSVNLEAPENKKIADQINKEAGQQGMPRVSVYKARTKSKSFQGYKAGFDYKHEMRRIIEDAETPGAVKGLIKGATIGAIAGGVIGTIVGAALGAKKGNAGVGALAGGLLGGALGSAIGVGVGALVGHVKGDDIGPDPASAIPDAGKVADAGKTSADDAKKPDDSAAQPKPTFEQALKEGAAVLKPEFGLASGGLLRPNSDDGYDADEWKKDMTPPEGDQMGGVVIVSTISSSWTAMDHLIKNIGKDVKKSDGTTTKWSFDCFEYVEVLRLYALWRTMDKDEFDKTFPHLEIGYHAPRMNQEWQKAFRADRPKQAPFQVSEPKTFEKGGVMHINEVSKDPVKGKTWPQLLTEAPVGSQVIWSNKDALDRCSKDKTLDFCAYSSENAMKLGPDSYAAHPFGVTNENAIRVGIATAVLEHDAKLTLAFKKLPEAKQDDYVKDYVSKHLKSYLDENIFISAIRFPVNLTGPADVSEKK